MCLREITTSRNLLSSYLRYQIYNNTCSNAHNCTRIRTGCVADTEGERRDEEGRTALSRRGWRNGLTKLQLSVRVPVLYFRSHYPYTYVCVRVCVDLILPITHTTTATKRSSTGWLLIFVLTTGFRCCTPFHPF